MKASTNKTAFTPGPWHQSKTFETTVSDEIGNTVADCSKSRVIEDKEMIANARLIAAAPELLAALDNVLRYCVTAKGFPDAARRTVEQQAAYDAARAAIAAATAAEGTHDNPIRYDRLEKSDPNYKEKMKAQLNKFESDAKAGKVLCLSDLMCSAGM